MSILQNAIDSIEIGLEDYNSGEKRRLLSATRNIYAGILLLFKHKLVLLSPLNSDEIFIKTTIKPVFNNGVLEWRGTGKKTVDFHDIESRFKDLNVTTDWQRLKNIQKYRNEIEHYFSSVNQSSVKTLISDCFIVIRDFITDELKENPLDLLDQTSWATMLSINEVFEVEKKLCEENLESLNYFSDVIATIFLNATCSNCGSSLLQTDSINADAEDLIYICKSCNHSHTYKDILEKEIENYYGYNFYRHIKDGGELPICDCPECGGTYLYEENICAECGFESDLECEMCGCRLSPEDLELEGICSSCNYNREKFFEED